MRQARDCSGPAISGALEGLWYSNSASIQIKQYTDRQKLKEGHASSTVFGKSVAHATSLHRLQHEEVRLVTIEEGSEAWGISCPEVHQRCKVQLEPKPARRQIPNSLQRARPATNLHRSLRFWQLLWDQITTSLDLAYNFCKNIQALVLLFWVASASRKVV